VIEVPIYKQFHKFVIGKGGANIRKVRIWSYVTQYSCMYSQSIYFSALYQLCYTMQYSEFLCAVSSPVSPIQKTIFVDSYQIYFTSITWCQRYEEVP
jgi:hypothetical protein